MQTTRPTTPGLQRAGLVGGLHGWAAWRPRSYSWWITLANLIGSTAFGVSAVAGLRQPGDRQVHNAARADTQTLIGAVCFLIGAVLLLPERTEKVSGQIVARVGDGTVTSGESTS